jgi:RNA polymerase sigma-70 factor (ECF subfamily)
MSIAAETPTVYELELSFEENALLTELHVEFYARLVRLCAGQLRDRSLAEDISQETILRAMRFWSSYDAERPTWPWLKAIALRLCSDARRARSREVYLEAMPEDALTSDDTENVVDEITLRRAVAGLPERQRLALHMRYFDDRDRDDSAQALGVNVNAFDQLVNRARLRLATAIAPATGGARLGLLWFPLRWMRRRLSPRGRGLIASSALRAAATAPLAVTPLLIIGGFAFVGPGEAEMPNHVTVSSSHYDRPATPGRTGVATAAARAGGSTPGTSLAAGPVHVHAWISKKPLGHGQIENHRMGIWTPVTTIYVDGISDRNPEPGAVCKLPVVTCK